MRRRDWQTGLMDRNKRDGEEKGRSLVLCLCAGRVEGVLAAVTC